MTLRHRRKQVRDLFVGFLTEAFARHGLATINTFFLPLPLNETELQKPFINIRTPDDALDEIYQITPYAASRTITVEIMLVIAVIDAADQAVQDKLDAYCLKLEQAILPYLCEKVEECNLSSSKMGADTQGSTAYGFIQNLYSVKWREEYTADTTNLPWLQTIVAGWDLAQPNGQLEATDTILFPTLS
jgi:hypothetical protein